MIRNGSSSSFEATNELGTSFLSTTSNSTISEEPLEDKIGEEFSKLKLEYSRQKIEIELMKRERDSIKNEVKTNDSAFKTQLSGSWKIIDSSNLEQYLQKRRAAAPTTTDLDDVIFHVALKNISFSADQVMFHEHIGSMKYNEKVVVLNQPVINEKGAESGELTSISGNSMKTVSIGSDGAESSEEYFVKDEHLHVMTRGFGVICERVYDRGSPLSNSTSNNTSNELLESLRNELKEMRREIKEIKDDVSVMKTEQEDQKEALNIITDNLKENEENQKKIQEDVARNQWSQEQILDELKVNVSSIQKDSKKEPESYSETDIRRQINGKWRNVDDHKWYFSAKFEGDTFMQKKNGCNSYTKYTIGVRDNSGWMVTVENNKIVKRSFTNHGEEHERNEYYIENKRLQWVDYNYGKECCTDTFNRVGEPEVDSSFLKHLLSIFF